MATNGQSVNPVTPVQAGQEKMEERDTKVGDKAKLEKVTVTLTDGESAVIMNTDALKLINVGLELQEEIAIDSDDSKMLQRDALTKAALLFLKAEINGAINRWDNLVSKMSKTARWRNSGKDRGELEKILRVHPKCKDMYRRAELARKAKLSIS